MILLLLTFTCTSDIPAIYRNSPHFSNAIGGGNLEVTAQAEPTTLSLGDSTIYSLTVRNVRNPGEVKRPKLDEAEFTVENLDSQVGADRVTFRYRLRPRDRSLRAIPSLRFEYYMPEAAEEHRLRTKFVDGISITIKPDSAEKPALADTVPERFRTLVADRPRSWEPTFAVWLSTPTAVAAIVVLWIHFWRRSHPDGARLAAIQRHAAVRRALAALQGPQDADAVATAMREYLARRFGIPSAALTPTDLSQWLSKQLSSHATTSLLNFLSELNTQRFGDGSRHDLAAKARDTILHLEEAAR